MHTSIYLCTPKLFKFRIQVQTLTSPQSHYSKVGYLLALGIGGFAVSALFRHSTAVVLLPADSLIAQMGALKYVEELQKKKQSDVLRFLLRVRCWEVRKPTHTASSFTKPPAMLEMDTVAHNVSCYTLVELR